jgi:hypothetical protein
VSSSNWLLHETKNALKNSLFVRNSMLILLHSSSFVCANCIVTFMILLFVVKVSVVCFSHTREREFFERRLSALIIEAINSPFDMGLRARKMIFINLSDGYFSNKSFECKQDKDKFCAYLFNKRTFWLFANCVREISLRNLRNKFHFISYFALCFLL